MRRLRMYMPIGSYRSGGRLRVFGPDAVGTLDTAAAMSTGEALVAHARPQPFEWCEGAWGRGAWIRERPLAGWCGAPWCVDAWCLAAAAVSARSKRIEHGSVQFAAQAIDGIGQSSGAMTVGAALVVSAPGTPRVDAMSVASGLVTITVGDPIA